MEKYCEYCNIGDVNEYIASKELDIENEVELCGVTDSINNIGVRDCTISEDYDYNKFILVSTSKGDFRINIKYCTECGREL